MDLFARIRKGRPGRGPPRSCAGGPAPVHRRTVRQAVEFDEAGEIRILGGATCSRKPCRLVRRRTGRLLVLWNRRQVRRISSPGPADTDYPDCDSCQNQTDTQRHKDPDRYRSGVDIPDSTLPPPPIPCRFESNISAARLCGSNGLPQSGPAVCKPKTKLRMCAANPATIIQIQPRRPPDSGLTTLGHRFPRRISNLHQSEHNGTAPHTDKESCT